MELHQFQQNLSEEKEKEKKHILKQTNKNI